MATPGQPPAGYQVVHLPGPPPGANIQYVTANPQPVQYVYLQNPHHYAPQYAPAPQSYQAQPPSQSQQPVQNPLNHSGGKNAFSNFTHAVSHHPITNNFKTQVQGIPQPLHSAPSQDKGQQQSVGPPPPHVVYATRPPPGAQVVYAHPPPIVQLPPQVPSEGSTTEQYETEISPNTTTTGSESEHAFPPPTTLPEPASLTVDPLPAALVEKKEEELKKMGMKELQKILDELDVNYDSCESKQDLVTLILKSSPPEPTSATHATPVLAPVSTGGAPTIIYASGPPPGSPSPIIYAPPSGPQVRYVQMAPHHPPQNVIYVSQVLFPPSRSTCFCTCLLSHDLQA